MSDKTDEDIKNLQEEMENEGNKLNEKKKTISRELQRRRDQVELEKSKLEQINSKLSKCRNLQELQENREEQMKGKLIQICQVQCSVKAHFRNTLVFSCCKIFFQEHRTLNFVKISKYTCFNFKATIVDCFVVSFPILN